MGSDLYILAVDQRPWLTQALWGHVHPASPAERAMTAKAKHAVLDALLRAVGDGIAAGCAGILVDAELGPGVAERARAEGLTVVMPIERAGAALYTDEPADVAAYLSQFEPDIAKVLVHYNPDSDSETNREQRRRLSKTSQICRDAGVPFMFELIVRPTDEQKALRQEDFEDLTRPELTFRAMEELVADVHVDIWKLESLGASTNYAKAAAVAASHQARCILLGANAPVEDVDQRLASAAQSGFVGFAIGRSIWWDATQAYLKRELTHDEAVSRMADRYAHFVGVFESNTR